MYKLLSAEVPVKFPETVNGLMGAMRTVPLLFMKVPLFAINIDPLFDSKLQYCEGATTVAPASIVTVFVVEA
jgi:hypothetical protein